MLKTAQAALNELVQRRSPPIIEVEHTKQEDRKARLQVINNMIVTRTLLEAFGPWFTLKEDVLECRKHMEALDYLIPKFRDFSALITKEELATAQASMHFMDRVSKTVTPLRKPEGYPSFSDEDESENIEVPVKNARAPPIPPTLDNLIEYIPDILRRMYHFRTSGEKTRLDKHQVYLRQALSELQEILKCDSAGEPDQTGERSKAKSLDSTHQGDDQHTNMHGTLASGTRKQNINYELFTEVEDLTSRIRGRRLPYQKGR